MRHAALTFAGLGLLATASVSANYAAAATLAGQVAADRLTDGKGADRLTKAPQEAPVKARPSFLGRSLGDAYTPTEPCEADGRDATLMVCQETTLPPAGGMVMGKPLMQVGDARTMYAQWFVRAGKIAGFRFWFPTRADCDAIFLNLKSKYGQFTNTIGSNPIIEWPFDGQSLTFHNGPVPQIACEVILKSPPPPRTGGI